MIGLPERTIVMRCEDAKEYVEAKLCVLYDKKLELLDELNGLNNEIEIEEQKKYMLENPPQPECNCNGNCSCDCNEESENPINILKRLMNK